MSNVDNEGLRTLDEVRAERFHADMEVRPARDARIGRGQITWLNPGELEEIEEAAKLGHGISPGEALAMTDEIRELSRRIAVRFNETAQARQAVRDLCQEIELLEVALKNWKDAGQKIADAVFDDRTTAALTCVQDRPANWLQASTLAKVVQAVQEIASLQTQLDARGPMPDLGQLADAIRGRDHAVRDAAQLREDRERVIERYRELQRSAKEEIDQFRTQLKDARVQLANLRQELEARYTKAQVADLQTAEATLVSRPLEARIQELETRVAEMVGEVADAENRRQAANQRAARASRNLERLERTVRHLQGTARIREDVVADLEARNQRLVDEMARHNREKDSEIADANRKLKSRETKIELLEVALENWNQAGQKIADAVFDDRTTAALEYTNQVPATNGSWTRLATVVQVVQAAMPAYRPAQDSPDVPAESS